RECFTFWETKPNEVLATILLGTNFALIATAVLATSIAIDLSHLFSLSPSVMIPVFSVGSIIVTLVGGDVAPKIFSRYKSEGVSVAGLPFLVALSKRSRSLNAFLLALSERIIGIFGQQATREKPFLQPDELRVLLTSDETLPLSTPERKMMRNILDFGKRRISRVMIPREKIQAVNLDQDPQKIIEQIIEKEYSRIPVYRGNLDNIVGIIYSRDLTLAWRGGSLFVINDLIRPAYFVPESARVDQVLREFRTGHQHMAVVVDEFGSAIGLATIEDLVEEIVGEIWDEYDIQEKAVFPMPDGSCLVRASESLDKVNEELGVNLPAAEFSTVSGWVLDIFGRIPRIGDTARWGNLEIEIVDADKKKILRVKIKKTAP
ncbi:MAG: hemolysin family protein, partial [Endomicrobiales bacterium]